MTSQIKNQIVIRIKSRDVKQTLGPKPLKAIQADKSLDRKQLKSEIVSMARSYWTPWQRHTVILLALHYFPRKSILHQAWIKLS